VHEVLNANVGTAVYMSSPNLPIRYSIENDGNGGADSMEQICTSVISEGGQEDTGQDFWFSTNGTHVDANAANSIYALVGIRLGTGRSGLSTYVHSVSVLTQTNDDFEWILIKNPTVADTFTYGAESGTPFEVARGATANTVTGGTRIAGGFGSSGTAEGSDIDFEGGLGEAIDGTRDTLVLCVRPLASNADIEGGINIHAGV
jgi:hypothetical protein